MQTVYRQLLRLAIFFEILVSDCANFWVAFVRNRVALAAENLFLCRQLALLEERGKKTTRTTAADRFVFSRLARLFDWRIALVIVKSATLIGWHRTAFRRYWRGKSRPVGRSPVPAEIRCLIRRMAAENPSWGEERIADELRLKLHIQLSPRTVGKYLNQLPGPRGSQGQRWSTFLHNHSPATAIASFSFTIGTRVSPTAWMKKSSAGGIHMLKSPVRMPTANAHCERLIGTIRRECLDYPIVLNAGHLRRILREWVSHYNGGRPHRSLGPGIPNQVQQNPPACKQADQSWRASRVIAKPILRGLHHEYRWDLAA